MSHRIFSDWSWSRYLGLLMAATILLTFTPGAFVLGSPTSDIQDAENQSDQSDRVNPLSRDATFMGSATILGMSTFGTLLTLMMGPTHKYGTKTTAAIFAMLGTIIILSTSLMFYACCLKNFDPSALGLFILMIGGGAFTIITAFAYIYEKRFKDTGSSSDP